ncbi:MAG: ATP-grasp domain-containing protein [Desulfovermiculus sp.]
MNILFTCAGRRNYLLHYFREALKDQGLIIAADMQSTAPAMAVADKAFGVPGVYNPGYVDKLLEICKNEQILVVISLNDLDLPILAGSRARFESIGTTVLVSAQKVIDICFDKWRTCEFARLTGVSAPKTYLSWDEAVKALDSKTLDFPLTLKPRWGSTSIGIEYPESMQELRLSYDLSILKLSRSILSRASSEDKDRAILFQEKLGGTEYGLDILNDLSGRPVQVYVKEKLAMRAGETDKAVLRKHPELEELGFKIGNALGHIGNLDCDIFETDGAFHLLEMNPRFGGGYPFSQMAGANFPAAIIAWLAGLEFDFSGFERKYDQPFAKCDTLIAVG